MVGEIRSATVRLTADTAQAVRDIKKVGDAGEQTATRLERSGRRSGISADKVGRGARNVALAGVAGLAALEKANISFDKQMSSVDAAYNLHGKNAKKTLGELRAEAIKLGADTQFSATEAAQGITELAKAGVSTKDVMGGGLKGALDLAAAGQLSVAESAETAASAMTQFRLKGKDVPHIADLLAAGAGKAQGSVHDLGMALNQSGLVASQTGLSIEDTTGTLAAFASAGLTGSDAGTSFKTMLLSLNPRSEQAAKLMKKLNIEAYDAQGRFIGIEQYAGKLRQGLKGLTQEQRAAALSTIFGSDAIRAANILYRNGAPGIARWIKKVDDSGYAAKTAAKQTDNLSGDLERVKGSLESAFIKGGSGGQKALRGLAQNAEHLIDTFAALPESVQGNVVKAVAALTGLSAAVAVVSKVGSPLLKAGRFVTGKRTPASALAKATGTVPVFVTNPGFGSGVGGPGAAAKGGVRGAAQKYGPGAALTAGGSFAGVGLLAGAASLGAAGNEVRKPTGYVPTSKLTPAQVKGLTAQQRGWLDIDKAARAAAQSQRTAGGAIAAAGQIIGVTNPRVKKYGLSLLSLPKGVRTKLDTPGAVKSIGDVRRLARQYDLTPKQVRTLLQLSGVDKARGGAKNVSGDLNRLNGKKARPSASLVDKASGPTSKVSRSVTRLGAQRARPTVTLIDRASGPIASVSARLGALNGKAAFTYATTIVSTVHKKEDGGTVGGLAGGGTVAGRRFPYGDKVVARVVGGGEIALAPGEEVITNRNGEADRFRADRAAGRIPAYADGGTPLPSYVSGGTGTASVAVVFPTPAVVKASVVAAEAVATAAAKTARSAKEIRDTNVDDLHAQQQIRDLQAELAKKEKVRVKGRDGKDDDKRKKGKQDKYKYVTRDAVRGLDREAKIAELDAAKKDLAEARDAIRATAAAELAAKRAESTTTLAAAGDIFARGTGAGSAIASVNRAIADITTYGQTVARLKAAGASPALLQQVVARAEQQGDFRSANRLGKALLEQPALLGRLNSSLATLGAVSGNVATLTTDPRLMQAKAWNPTSTVAKTVEVTVNVKADPSTWAPEITRQVTHQVQAAVVGL